LKVLTYLTNCSDCILQTAFNGVFGGRGPGGRSPPAAVRRARRSNKVR
jgi:hypothetical protein